MLTGAGMSQESGISTFRDSNGLWNNHDIMEVASPFGWQKNPELVLEFYNQRRKQLNEVHPNAAHHDLAKLEKYFEVHIITQNVDDLHERAGSTKVLHLHGELFKVRSQKNENLVYDWKKDLSIGDLAEDGAQLRPDIVWFGESVPNIMIASEITEQADIFVIIGTGMQVYPAAGLIHALKTDVPIYYIDPKPHPIGTANPLEIIGEKATFGVAKLVRKLIKNIESK